MQKIYLDNAATTRIHPKVLEKMLPFLKDDFGNPSSIHSFGRKVRVAVEDARESIANLINANPSEIYFLSSGTEANNFSVFGIAKTEYNESGRKKVITTKAEHHCVFDSFKKLNEDGFDVIFNEVNPDTKINIEQLKNNIKDEVSLISVIHTNNETGSVNNIQSISKLINPEYQFLHTDAVQSFGKIKLDVKELGVNALTASGHKINGPKGIGFAYVKSGTPLAPMIFGGSQERNRRGGTENVSGIIGLVEAAKIAYKNMDSNEQIVKNLKNKFISGIKNIDSKYISINGGDDTSPFIVSITFDNRTYNNDAEAMLMYLDINGIAASNGAACTSGTLNPSHVIMSAGKLEIDASGTIRFSFSYENTDEEIDYTLDVLRKMSNKFKK